MQRKIEKKTENFSKLNTKVLLRRRRETYLYYSHIETKNMTLNVSPGVDGAMYTVVNIFSSDRCFIFNFVKWIIYFKYDDSND